MKRNWLLKTAAAAIFAMLATSTLTAAAATLSYPYGVALDPNSGVLYIADPSKGVFAYNPATNALSPFAAGLTNAFSLAVNKNGFVHVGVLGANAQIKVFNAQGAAINALPVPAGDSPITLAFDGDNILYEGNGYASASYSAEINAFTNDLTLPYNRTISAFPGGPPLDLQPYATLQTYTEVSAGGRYALAYDDGQIFLLGYVPRQGGNPNIYDTRLLLSGRAKDFGNQIAECMDASCSAYIQNHILPFSGAAFAGTVDGNHNIFYASPDSMAISVTTKGGAPKRLLGNLPSAPYGIAFDKTRSRLYVAFPDAHQVLAYTVTYTKQNGVKVPALSSPPAIIQ